MSTEGPAMPIAETEGNKPKADSLLAEFQRCWQQLPYKGLFFSIFGTWVLVFHFLGTSTLGYVETPSLFGWLDWVYSRGTTMLAWGDDAHGYLIPFIVAVLFWSKRSELLALPKAHWWPALGIVVFASLLHIFGYMVQQARISVVAFFVGFYGITGLVWGFRWLYASFFPFFLFAFCLPLSGGPSEMISFPLRLIATKITAFISQTGLGINVIQDGSRIFDASGSYQYEVAAACSGMRSLTATIAMSVIYAFVALKSPWRRAIMIASAVPFAVAANVVRLMTIIVASEAFGATAGNFVHNSSLFSLLPYIPAFIGVLILGRFLQEKSPGPDRNLNPSLNLPNSKFETV